MGDEKHRIVEVQNVKPYRSPRQKRQVLVAAVVVLIAAGLGVAAWLLLAPLQKSYTLRGYETATVQKAALVQSTQASGTVAVPVQMSLPSPEEGYAAALYAAEGDTVKKGQVLARIDVPALRNALQDLQSSLAEAKRSYEKTVASNRIDLDRKARDITSAAGDVDSAQADIPLSATL